MCIKRHGNRNHVQREEMDKGKRLHGPDTRKILKGRPSVVPVGFLGCGPTEAWMLS